MKRVLLILFAAIAVAAQANLARGVQYEPPINIVFIIHEDPMQDTTEYPTHLAFLQWLEEQSMTRPYQFKLTTLMGGDFAEYAIHMGDQPFFDLLESEGHQLGTHAHPRIQVAPLTWIDVDQSTYRYGVPFYDPLMTAQIWSDNTYWINQLTADNRAMCAFPFLCSTEGSLMTQFGFVSDPGNRSEKGLDYFGHLVRHPFRPGSDNRLGHELEEDLGNPFIYIDHYAQIGNENAHGYNCTEPVMEEALDACYQEWLAAEMTPGDSLDYKVWTFGFLTHLWLYSPYYEDQISTFLDYIEANYVDHYTPRGNLIAKYSTVAEVVEEYTAWETTHPGESSFSYIHPYPQYPLVNEVMVIPADSSQGSEWIELYNPTAAWINISGYEISTGILDDPNFWRMPPNSWFGPHEYLLVAHNGNSFRARYGIRPDFEVSGNTGARLLFTQGAYSLHDDHDGCVVENTSNPPPNTNTTITDGVSWGEDYAAGFTLSEPVVNHTFGRDAISTDTGYSNDWSLNGGAPAPTPGGANSAAFFSPQLFVTIDPAWVPMLVGPSGGTVVFDATVGNEYPTVQVVDIWTDVVMPSGQIYGPIIVRQNRNLAPQDSITLTLSQYIPPGAPAGFYRYNLHLGDYPTSNTDLSYFYFEKLGYIEDGQTSWPKAELPEWLAAEDSPSPNRQTAAKLTITATPNPFNPTTSVAVILPQSGAARLEIFDISGRRILTHEFVGAQAGLYQVEFDGSCLSSGLYVMELRQGTNAAVAKALLIK